MPKDIGGGKIPYTLIVTCGRCSAPDGQWNLKIVHTLPKSSYPPTGFMVTDNKASGIADKPAAKEEDKHEVPKGNNKEVEDVVGEDDDDDDELQEEDEYEGIEEEEGGDEDDDDEQDGEGEEQAEPKNPSLTSYLLADPEEEEDDDEQEDGYVPLPPPAPEPMSRKRSNHEVAEVEEQPDNKKAKA